VISKEILKVKKNINLNAILRKTTDKTLNR